MLGLLRYSCTRLSTALTTLSPSTARAVQCGRIKQPSAMRILQSPLVRLQSTAQAAKPVVDNMNEAGRKLVGKWLITMAGMTFGAVLLGGVTRLTESGLSMVDWHPIKERPPFSNEEWLREFEKYKKFPEYQYVLSERGGMTLSEFKFIWYMEYGHRMWGRAIGLMYAVPTMYFIYKGYLSNAMKNRVILYGTLIGFQGMLGWYMVRSGLEHRIKTTEEGAVSNSVPRVSQYRLAAHLGSAIVLYSLFLHAGLTHLVKPLQLTQFPKLKMIIGMTHGVKAMVFLTAVSGAFVAGLDAGLTYNSWPKMADRWIPDDIFSNNYSPRWKNLFENPTAVQFDHRWLGQFTGLLVLALWGACWQQRALLPRRVRLAAHAVLGAALLQITLGVATLVHMVPVPLAAAHQSGSLVLLGSAIWLAHSLRRVPK